MSEALRIILRNCGPDDMILAGRAAKWGLTEMTNKDGILTYGEPVVAAFYVRRNKASMTVWKETAGSFSVDVGDGET